MLKCRIDLSNRLGLQGEDTLQHKSLSAVFIGVLLRPGLRQRLQRWIPTESDGHE